MEQLRNLQDILDGTGAGTWDWDVSTGALQVNARWAEILGQSLEALHPVSFDKWKALVHPDDFPLTEAAVAAHMAKRTPRYDCEFRMRHASGQWIWIHSSGQIRAWNITPGLRESFAERRRIEAEDKAKIAKHFADIRGKV